MRFCKFNGAGNDFIILNNIKEQLPAERFPAIAKTVCERHLSVGADGLMVVEASDKADFRMIYYNSDGSLGEMCGNGARCICRYGYEMGLSDETQTIETTSGVMIGRRIDQRRYRIRLPNPSRIELDYDIELDGVTYPCSYVELGKPSLPHAVIPMEGLREKTPRQLYELGRHLRFHSVFPKGANINFYEITGENRVFLRTYERGVEDFTYACGTGTACVALVLLLKGLTPDGEFHADMEGGELTIDLRREKDDIKTIYLTGPTNFVASGVIMDDELDL